VASSYKEAIMLSINAGVDMAMIPYDYAGFCNDLISLVKENKVPVSRINDAVKRILKMKLAIGLFEKPVTDISMYPRFGSKDFTRSAYDCAAESITLLKNKNGLLPLPQGAKVLVTGPTANSMRTLNGGWSYSWQGEKTEMFSQDYHTILTAMQKNLGKENVSYFPGVNFVMDGKYYQDTAQQLNELLKYAASVDYILVCLGENSYTEKPGDLNDLALSPNQQALALMAAKTGKPVILVLNEGRPRVISNIEESMSAVLMTYLPGNYGADALCDILTGKVNPSGKLPITYPRYVNSLATYIHKYSDQQTNPQGAYDYSADYNPQYDFGFGLSYSSFEYYDLLTDQKQYAAGDTIIVSVKLKNTGKLAGKEVVQLYASDLVASLSPDVKRLRGFEKYMLRPGEVKQVVFELPVNSLSFVGSDNKHQLEPGEFRLEIGGLNSIIQVR
jgi:beta-glucosidase